MIIDVTGFGWSGSGAVHDLLREYSDVNFASYDNDWEFTLLWEPDGIYDLEYKLCNKHCRTGDSSVAIKRFLKLIEAQNKTTILGYNRMFKGNYEKICKQYINTLVQFSYEGYTFEDWMKSKSYSYIQRAYNFIIHKIFGNKLIRNIIGRDLTYSLVWQNKHTIYVSYNPDNFLEKTQIFLNKLLSFFNSGKDVPIVTDQLFPPDLPTLFFKYINEPIRCVVVRRDPRDMYLLAKNTYNSSIPLPVSNVEDFILFYKKTVEETILPNSETLRNLRFEDLIYHYDETVREIESFLGISKHERPKSRFNPAVSVNNTQLFKKYNGFEEDIRKIEKALPDSLYPFESAPKVAAVKSHVF